MRLEERVHQWAGVQDEVLDNIRQALLTLIDTEETIERVVEEGVDEPSKEVVPRDELVASFSYAPATTYEAFWGETTTVYSSYRAPYAEQDDAGVVAEVVTEPQIEEGVRREIYLTKLHSAGNEFSRTYASADEKEATEWYKMVNRFFIMLMYEITG